MAIKNIIFDFDDTLADFSGAREKVTEVLNKFFYDKYKVKGFGEMFDSIDTETAIKARTRKDSNIANRASWARLAAKRLGVTLTNNQCQEIRKLYWKIILKETKQMPYATEVLMKLNKKYNLYVLSDADGEDAKEKIGRIKKLNMYRFFKGSSFGDVIKTTKPDRKFYTYLLKKHKMNTDECVMVGDKPQYDLIPAKDIEMKTVWIKYGRWADSQKNKRFNYVDYTINDLRELLRILK